MKSLDSLYQQIGRQYVLNYVAIGSGIGRLKPKNCKKGWSCGYSCQSKDKKNCRSPLEGQSKTYADWLSKQADRIESKPAKSKPAKTSSLGQKAAQSNLTANPKFSLVDISAITFRGTASKDPKTEAMAESILKHGLLTPLLLKRSGIDSFEPIDSDSPNNAASVLAKQKDPRKAEMVNAFAFKPEEEPAIREQMKLLPPRNQMDIVGLKGKADYKLTDVSAITSDTKQSDFNKQHLEALADSILKSNGLIQPIVLVRTGPEQFRVVSGHMEYHAAVIAKQKDPRKAEMINSFIGEPS